MPTLLVSRLFRMAVLDKPFSLLCLEAEVALLKAAQRKATEGCSETDFGILSKTACASSSPSSIPALENPAFYPTSEGLFFDDFGYDLELGKPNASPTPSPSLIEADLFWAESLQCTEPAQPETIAPQSGDPGETGTLMHVDPNVLQKLVHLNVQILEKLDQKLFHRLCMDVILMTSGDHPFRTEKPANMTDKSLKNFVRKEVATICNGTTRFPGGLTLQMIKNLDLGKLKKLAFALQPTRLAILFAQHILPLLGYEGETDDHSLAEWFMEPLSHRKDGLLLSPANKLFLLRFHSHSRPAVWSILAAVEERVGAASNDEKISVLARKTKAERRSMRDKEINAILKGKKPFPGNLRLYWDYMDRYQKISVAAFVVDPQQIDQQFQHFVWTRSLSEMEMEALEHLISLRARCCKIPTSPTTQTESTLKPPSVTSTNSVESARPSTEGAELLKEVNCDDVARQQQDSDPTQKTRSLDDNESNEGSSIASRNEQKKTASKSASDAALPSLVDAYSKVDPEGFSRLCTDYFRKEFDVVRASCSSGQTAVEHRSPPSGEKAMRKFTKRAISSINQGLVPFPGCLTPEILASLPVKRCKALLVAIKKPVEVITLMAQPLFSLLGCIVKDATEGAIMGWLHQPLTDFGTHISVPKADKLFLISLAAPAIFDEMVSDLFPPDAEPKRLEGKIRKPDFATDLEIVQLLEGKKPFPGDLLVMWERLDNRRKVLAVAVAIDSSRVNQAFEKYIQGCSLMELMGNKAAIHLFRALARQQAGLPSPLTDNLLTPERPRCAVVLNLDPQETPTEVKKKREDVARAAVAESAKSTGHEARVIHSSPEFTPQPSLQAVCAEPERLPPACESGPVAVDDSVQILEREKIELSITNKALEQKVAESETYIRELKGLHAQQLYDLQKRLTETTKALTAAMSQVSALHGFLATLVDTEHQSEHVSAAAAPTGLNRVVQTGDSSAPSSPDDLTLLLDAYASLYYVPAAPSLQP